MSYTAFILSLKGGERMKKVLVSFRIAPALLRKLEHQSMIENESVSELLRLAVVEFLQRREGKE